MAQQQVHDEQQVRKLQVEIMGLQEEIQHESESDHTASSHGTATSSSAISADRYQVCIFWSMSMDNTIACILNAIA